MGGTYIPLKSVSIECPAPEYEHSRVVVQHMQRRLLRAELSRGRLDRGKVCEVELQEDGLLPRIALELSDGCRRLVRVIRCDVYFRVARQEDLHTHCGRDSARHPSTANQNACARRAHPRRVLPDACVDVRTRQSLHIATDARRQLTSTAARHYDHLPCEVRNMVGVELAFRGVKLRQDRRYDTHCRSLRRCGWRWGDMEGSGACRCCFL